MKDNRQNTPDQRLKRIETRLTNFGKYMGFDLTVPPPPNEPDQPVFISDGAVYVTPHTPISTLTVAVLRYQFWERHDREVPVIMHRRTIATIDPIGMRDAAAPYMGDDNG